ncbi:MAG: P22 phage major capsid protein family protein, partial [Bacteroidales bacterium]
TLTSKDATLELKDFSKQIIAPAMAAIAEQIDADIANYIFENAATTVSRSATSPNTLTNIAALGKALDKAKAPLQDRSLVFSPDHKYAYALTDNLSKAAYAGDSQALRDANLGKLYSMETYMDQNNPASTATTSGTAVGTMKITGIVGAGTVAVTELDTNAVTLAAGDGFIYDGVLYRASAGDTATLKAIAALAITPNSAGLAGANVNSAVTVQIVRNSTSVAFHKNAVAFVNRPLAVPQGAVKAAVASADGLSVRVVYGYDMSSKSDTISFDILYGIKYLRTALMVRLVDGTLS